MNYITPNGTVELFKGINLDNRYMHTVFFSTPTAQNNAFSNRVFKRFNNQMYRRYTTNSIKVEAKAGELLGVTYMRFKNSDSDMWFYCFVNAVEYISETTSAITFEIDVMQTWFIQKGRINPCMVLREHTNDDTFGNNLEPEAIGSDSYVIDELTFYDDLTEYWVVIQTTGEPQANSYLPQNIFDGTHREVWPCNDSTDASYVIQRLGELLGSWDAGEREQEIIDMYMMPATYAQSDGLPVEKDIDFNMPVSFSNYKPKNNKLWMYPFSYLTCTTKCGDGGTFKWEYFKDVSPQSTEKVHFTRLGTYIGGGHMMCYPKWYNGITKNIDCAINYSDFPKCAFTFDAYQAWVANGGKTKYENERTLTVAKGASAVLKTYASAVNNAASASKPMPADTTPLAMASNVTNGMLKTMTNALDTGIAIKEAFNKVDYTFKDAMYEPNQVVGVSMPSVDVGNRIPNFYFQHVHLKDDEARRADDFLSCYGYATNRIKVPNLTGRRYWNFIKTENCTIAGDMPASSKEAIGRIFDGGITIWHNLEQVGNYNQSITDGSVNNPII